MSQIHWYHRDGQDPWQLAACEHHGAELAELGFSPGLHERYADHLGRAEVCPLCTGSTSLADVRACRCHCLGQRCPVHAPQPAGAPGDVVRVGCAKCGAQMSLPADRVAFRPAELGPDIALDLTGWAIRQGDGPELRCPFHGSQVYFLERIDADDDDHGDGRDAH